MVMNGRESESLIDPTLLKELSEEQRQEALAAEAAARRAEERAEQRALERALKAKEEERRLERLKQAPQSTAESSGTGGIGVASLSPADRVVFVSSTKRKKAASEHEKAEHDGAADAPLPKRPVKPDKSRTDQSRTGSSSTWNNPQWAAVKQSYLGKSLEETEEAQLERRKQRVKKKKTTFKFQWDNTDDTSHLDEDDPLYTGMISAGTIRNKNTRKPRVERELKAVPVTTLETAKTKPLADMTVRDWRILRENYNILVKGGKAPPPMRSFRESPSTELPTLHVALLNAIEQTMKFKEPSPIQRQAIPIGLQRRDLIGIAETGSGKTVAFGAPLCHYILTLPEEIKTRVADQGALAVVLAPTRELALQIDVEFQKLLSRQSEIRSYAVVGGQPILQQAQNLRDGVHVVVGTPGRLNECLEMAYLVLNQCCYVVLDEADRMIDMGFAPQIESILDAMGGILKSEDEALTYQQELEDLKNRDLPLHRVTAMFSATMPPEVEQMANRYLRHPAVISVGDRDSRKNSRIQQKIMFLSSPNQKEKVLRDLLNRGRPNDKVIVFVNEKRQADVVGRLVERFGKRCVVLHGGKSQDQREANLDAFRKGGAILVATDVAGRGLDIPDVTHVINYYLPTRSIENYTHRIGRTGRAGKTGQATSFMTEEDEGIMPLLKAYLESTGNPVPERLARHPAAVGNPKQRNIT